MQDELHLFIIWETARNIEDKILEEINQNFEIKQTFSITWSPYQVSRNFTRFYGQSLPRNSHKELHCGYGEFRLIIVNDTNPIYQERKTSKGHKIVNINMFDTKTRLRKMTDGGHKIHGTDTEKETKHDLVLLIGLSTLDFKQEYIERKNDIKLKQDLIGTNGWNSFNELFYVLNECSEYVILRNSENINLKYFMHNTGDIDILSKDASEIAYVLGDIDSIENKSKHLKIDIDKHIILFEVDQSGCNLFDVNFENSLFNNKVKTNGIWHLNEELEMYALIYHALLYKEFFQEKHKKRILIKYKQFIIDTENLEQELLMKLINFFKKHEYKFIAPNDGYFNFRSQIKPILAVNKMRDSFIIKVLKSFIVISRDQRYMKIIILKLLNKLIILEIKLPFSFSIGLNIGYK